MKILTKGEYYGSLSSELRANGLVISEYDYKIPRTDWHFHENPYFMYVLQGDLYDVNKQQRKQCPAGSFIFHNWQEAHFNEKHSKNARGFHIEFERKWFEQQKLDVGLWEGSQLLHNPQLHHLLGKLYYEFRTADAFTTLSIELLLLQICEGMKEHQEVDKAFDPTWITQLKELIHSNSNELSLASLSKELGVHPVHISRTIPKYLNSTLGEYIRKQKVKQAFDLMLNANHSLTEVAYLCGFSDQSHFTRTFKAYYKCTPMHFRKAMFGNAKPC